VTCLARVHIMILDELLDLETGMWHRTYRTVAQITVPVPGTWYVYQYSTGTYVGCTTRAAQIGDMNW
jgi:hypothetical protein